MVYYSTYVWYRNDIDIDIEMLDRGTAAYHDNLFVTIDPERGFSPSNGKKTFLVKLLNQRGIATLQILPLIRQSFGEKTTITNLAM